MDGERHKSSTRPLTQLSNIGDENHSLVRESLQRCCNRGGTKKGGQVTGNQQVVLTPHQRSSTRI